MLTLNIVRMALTVREKAGATPNGSRAAVAWCGALPMIVPWTANQG